MLPSAYARYPAAVMFVHTSGEGQDQEMKELLQCYGAVSHIIFTEMTARNLFVNFPHMLQSGLACEDIEFGLELHLFGTVFYCTQNIYTNEFMANVFLHVSLPGHTLLTSYRAIRDTYD